MDVALIRTWKYRAEEYPLGIDFTRRLRTGQSVISGTVTAEDINGTSVSASLLGTITASNPLVTVVLKKDYGIVGQLYYLRVVAVTAQDSLEQIIELEIKDR